MFGSVVEGYINLIWDKILSLRGHNVSMDITTPLKYLFIFSAVLFLLVWLNNFTDTYSLAYIIEVLGTLNRSSLYIILSGALKKELLTALLEI